VFTPATVTGAYLHIHGGGWCLGSARYQDERLWSVACDAGVAVVSIEYRLAPEHPHPAGFEDCRSAASWLVDACVSEFGVDRIVIGGESAGAHLAALTLIALRDRGESDRIFGANLVSGIYDLSMTPSQRRWGPHPIILSTPILASTYDRYVPGRTDDERRDPSVSPLYADLAGLPPTLFTVGEADPLLDDSIFMAARWHAAGNQTALDVYPEAAHGFIAKPLGLATLAHERMTGWMRSLLNAEFGADAHAQNLVA
jgi:acetyl esterase/lipase